MRPSSFVCWSESSRPCRYSSTRTPRAGAPRSVSSTCVEMEGRSAIRLAPGSIHRLKDGQNPQVVYVGTIVAFQEQGGLRHHGAACTADQFAHGLQWLACADNIIDYAHPLPLHLDRVASVDIELLLGLGSDRFVAHRHGGQHERTDFFAADDVGLESEVRGDGVRQRDTLRLSRHEQI